MKWLRTNWRALLSRAPLPMLALAASYGVYSFALLFVPWWVALAQAAAFESTYLGLAVLESSDAAKRKRAGAISIGAVVVSVIYNSAAGFFHRNPDTLLGTPWYAEVALAMAHGAPLAIVAYLVADLLLHATRPTRSVPVADSALTVKPQSATPAPLSKSAVVKQLALARGVSESTIWRGVKAGDIVLNGTKEVH